MKLCKLISLLVTVILLTTCFATIASAESDLVDSIYSEIQFGKHPNDLAGHFIITCGYSEAEWYSAAQKAIKKAQDNGYWPSDWNTTLDSSIGLAMFADTATAELGDNSVPFSIMCMGMIASMLGYAVVHMKRKFN